MAVALKRFVRDIPDFPQSGIVFKDATPLLLHGEALDQAVNGLGRLAAGLDVDFVLAPEARGFILGGALARELGSGFIPARRPGKLPSEPVSAEYALAYRLNPTYLPPPPRPALPRPLT